MSRLPARADAPPAAEKGLLFFVDHHAGAEPREASLGDECARTSTLAAAGLGVGIVLCLAIDPSGTALMLRDAIQWWTLW